MKKIIGALFLLISGSFSQAMEKPSDVPSIFGGKTVLTPEQQAEVAKLPAEMWKYKLRDFIIHHILQESRTLDDAIQRIKELAQPSAYKDILAFDYDYIKKYGPFEWLVQQQHAELDAIMKLYLYALKHSDIVANKDFVIALRKALPGLDKLEKSIERLHPGELLEKLQQLATDSDTAPFINSYHLFENILKRVHEPNRLYWQIRIVTKLRLPVATKFIRKNIKWSDIDYDISRGVAHHELIFLVQNLPTIDDQKHAALIMNSAVLAENIEFIKLLLAKGYDPNIQISPVEMGQYDTPLMEAIRLNSPEMVKLFLEAGANPNKHAHYVVPPSVWTTELPLIRAIRYGQVDIVRLLLFNPFAQQIQQLRTAQQQESYLGIIPPELVIQAAEDAKPTLKADPNLPDGSGRRALNEAAAGGNLEIIRMLLAAGAQINEKDRDGRTPLMAAVISSRYNTLDLVKLLVEKGADITLPDNQGYSVLDYAEYKQGILDYLKNVLKQKESK